MDAEKDQAACDGAASVTVIVKQDYSSNPGLVNQMSLRIVRRRGDGR
jgi:hypothetical protein